MNAASKILFGLVCLAAVGCGSDGPFDYVPVQGKFTYEDGDIVPASGIRLQFIALDAKPVGDAHPRPGIAGLNAQGEFESATSYKYGDGLTPGRHKVAIFYAEDKDGNLLVPKEYTNAATTPLIIDTADSPLEIKVPRP